MALSLDLKGLRVKNRSMQGIKVEDVTADSRAPRTGGREESGKEFISVCHRCIRNQNQF